MQVLHTISQTREIILNQKQKGRSLGLAPTMGALHQGHLSLIRRSAAENDFTVVSIFVNPLQFGPNEDLDAYPRTPDSDIEAAQSAGADLIFHPSAEEILGKEMLAFVDIEKLQDNLCGRSRPGHFRGVCTIVAKLFNIITPDRAYFGQKDMQQFIILKKMAQDLNFDIDMLLCPIVRESDGLAMSSRNKYLSPAQRRDAVVLHRAIDRGMQLYGNGETNAKKIISALVDFIRQTPSARIDYVSIVDEDMQDVAQVQKGHILALAVFIGKTRLIDNHIFGEPVTL